ncbi:hypothetical protein B4V02_00855 [Paenibacillus kribbensis]|uniref:Hint domain-containing protein n=1 Tax=Paenibacillus kribbensis TaxID=172713 RepID=A0A222WH55_9BACL|nr:hypothetical protein B4V02_00855 [Paenibacillus kribbensis]
MAEAEVVGGTAKIMYAYVYDLSGQLWARQDRASGQLQYYQLNGHGDVVGLSDSSGKELNSYTYDIWGGPETVKETVPNVLRYAGEYWDDTTGLQYLRARWYDPGTARFMGEDTYQGEITSPLSLNGYTYVHNNPLTNSDPTGNWCTATVRGKYYSHPGYCSGSGKNADYIPDSISINFGRSIYAAGVKQGTWYPKGAARVKWDKSGISDAVMGCYYDVQCASFVSGSLVEGPAIAKITKGKSASTGKTAKDIISKCNCFTAGTKVQTDEGEKPIEDIEVGEWVLSKDEATGEVAYKEVTATFNHETDEIYQIKVGNQVIESTFNHPFYVKGKGWTFVKDLKIGDLLVQSDGNTLKVDSIKVEHKHITVYNMTVDEFHNYFVSDLEIWVHNTGPCFTNINFKTNLYKRYEDHMFSLDHIKGGIMKLGKERESIFNSVTGKIGSVNPKKIQQGSNQMYSNINGYDVTIRFYADANGTIINVDAFMGKATRVIGNLIN